MKKNRRGHYVAIGLLVLLLAATWYVAREFTPVSGSETRTIAVRPGESTRAIATQLQQQGLIRSVWSFQLYLAFHRESQSLQPGSYRLTQGMTYGQLSLLLRKGDPSYGTVRFTIPEGYTVDQIAALLAGKGVVHKSDFLHEVDYGVFQYDFVKEIPAGIPVHHRLEGYLFPDTYEVYRNASAHQIVDVMLAEFQRRLTSTMRAQIAAKHMTVYQIVTIASLIEREAKVAKERPIIAGIIYNRLNATPPIPLQIDAAIEFAVGAKPVLTVQDLQVKSPYNLYTHTGLPPGPIASPGLDSLEAAIAPAHTTYLYYVAKNDGSGQHYFSATFQEQLVNEQKSEQYAKKQTS